MTDLFHFYFKTLIKGKSNNLYKSYCRVLPNYLKYFDTLTITLKIAEYFEDSVQSLCRQFLKECSKVQHNTNQLLPSKCFLPWSTYKIATRLHLCLIEPYPCNPQGIWIYEILYTSLVCHFYSNLSTHKCKLHEERDFWVLHWVMCT